MPRRQDRFGYGVTDDLSASPIASPTRPFGTPTARQCVRLPPVSEADAIANVDRDAPSGRL